MHEARAHDKTEGPMTTPSRSRRDFLAQAATLSAAASLPASLTVHPTAEAVHLAAGDWDLSWVTQLKDASDRAVVDAIGPSDIPLQIATRYLDNCDAAYGAGRHSARLVLNFRTRAIPLAMNDAAWERFSLGEEYSVKERPDGATARRNPFLTVPAGSVRELGAVNDLVARKAIVLVCDFSMGHLANRLADKAKADREETHRALRESLIPGAYLMPSGIFGMARAQNAGCAFVNGGG